MSLALRIFGLALACSVWQSEAASARSLEMIRATGALHLCAHPNSLPYASKAGNPPGFQIELGELLAEELGVSLATEWIVIPSQTFRADCDIILDAIADPEAQAETGLRLSKPYYRSGVGLAVPRGQRHYHLCEPERPHQGWRAGRFRCRHAAQPTARANLDLRL
jgi:polar amino acid transport system substrate-binding protein